MISASQLTVNPMASPTGLHISARSQRISVLCPVLHKQTLFHWTAVNFTLFANKMHYLSKIRLLALLHHLYGMY